MNSSGSSSQKYPALLNAGGHPGVTLSQPIANHPKTEPRVADHCRNGGGPIDARRMARGAAGEQFGVDRPKPRLPEEPRPVPPGERLARADGNSKQALGTVMQFAA